MEIGAGDLATLDEKMENGLTRSKTDDENRNRMKIILDWVVYVLLRYKKQLVCCGLRNWNSFEINFIALARSIFSTVDVDEPF